jgi:very-short-patch-repair endonuclease
VRLAPPRRNTRSVIVTGMAVADAELAAQQPKRHARAAALARERRLARLAARQWGLVTRRQLATLGYAPGAIASRIASGRLHRVHRGVYCVGHPVLAREGRWMAAVLAGGDDAVLSHHSAAALWDLLPARGTAEVTTGPGRRAPAGIRLHQTRRLAAGERTVRRGIAVTTVERTIADLAGVVSAARLGRVLARAEALELVDVPTLLRCAHRRPGAVALRSLLADWAPSVTRTELEDRLLMVVLKAGLPRPEVNARLHGYEVDLLWRGARIVAEADGHAFHASRAQIERDRRREAVLAAHGHRVLRFTWQQVTRRPAEVVRALRAALA